LLHENIVWDIVNHVLAKNRGGQVLKETMSGGIVSLLHSKQEITV
jgi:hypothetical protein